MIRIRAVQPLGGYRLHLECSDGSGGTVDLSDDLWGPVFAPLRDPARFAEVSVDRQFGTVAWPGDIVLDPDVLYHQATGAPLPSAAPAAPDAPAESGRGAA